MMCLCVSACVLGFVTCFVCACCLHSFFSGGLSYAGMNGVLMVVHVCVCMFTCGVRACACVCVFMLVLVRLFDC